MKYDPNAMVSKYGKLYDLMYEIYQEDKNEGETLYQWYRCIYKAFKEWILVNKILRNKV